MSKQTSEPDNQPGTGQARLYIWMILILAGLLGGFYTFLLPPWQHYDEPNHFEYAWLISHPDQLRAGQNYSPKLSRQILKSMLANGFYDHLYEKPEIQPPNVKIQVPGYTQLGEQPLYYRLASLPFKLMEENSLEAQLYAARLVSVLFLLLAVLSGWGIAVELGAPGDALRWMLPLTLVLTPAFVDLMSAVNNDSAAIALTSVYLWMTARLVQRGFAWLDFGVLVLSSMLMVATKITAALALSVLPLTLLFVFFRGRSQKLVWIASCVGIGLLLVFSFRWDDAQGWYRSSSQASGVRLKSAAAPAGKSVFAVESGAVSTPGHIPEFYQHIPGDIGSPLAGNKATFGYWIWSDQPQEAAGPVLRTAQAVFQVPIPVAGEPSFHAFQVELPEDTDRIWIDLSPRNGIKGSTVYYDGLVLAVGEYPTTSVPVFHDPYARSGAWGGQPFQNIIRNASAETAGVRVAPVLDNLATRFLPDSSRPSLLIASFLDPPGSFGLYKTSAVHIFQTFWARFAWGHVPIFAGGLLYWLLAIFSPLGWVGFVLYLVNSRRAAPLQLALIYSLVVIQFLLMALTRGGAYLAVPGFYIPVARHMYPVIIPVLWFITAGWLELFRIANRSRGRVLVSIDSAGCPSGAGDRSTNNFWFFLGYIGFLLLINIASVLGILAYYYHIFDPSA